MKLPAWILSALMLLPVPIPALSQSIAKPAGTTVAVTLETTLTTAGGQIRQLAFDGNPDTFFASEKNPGSGDHFTLTFDQPVIVKTVHVTTGRPNGQDALEAGALEASADGKLFEALVKFSAGKAIGELGGKKIRAVRIKATDELRHPLVVREFVIESDPPVATFKYPVEIVVDVDDVPDLRDWAEKVARVCERQYPMICEELRSDGFKPRQLITMTLKNDYNGVAATSGGRITGSVKYFKAHPDDFGAMVHETVHCVQQYRTRNNPGWLVEGIADYIRFFKFEPGKIGRINPDRARYNGSYRVSAAFLAYVVEKYDKELVRKLNQAMREGEYKEELWKLHTKKSLQELDEEWRASLRK